MSTLLLLGFAVDPSHAEARLSEAAVKAAYVFRFAGYVDWPALPAGGEPFVIAVVDDPDVTRELHVLSAAHPLHQHPVEIREINHRTELAGAQILYVGPHHDALLRELIAGAVPALLVITGEEQGLALGGVINFLTVDRRIRFEVSLTAAQREQLAISAELLSVAIRVLGEHRLTGTPGSP